MIPLRVTVLGSGTIIPSRERSSTSLFIEAGRQRFLFDCGPGVMQAMEELTGSYHSAERIFLTHFHPDHTLGIGHYFSAIRNDRSLSEMLDPVIYGPVGLESFMEGWGGLYTSFSKGIDVELIELGDGDGVLLGEVEITAARAEHAEGAALSYRVSYAGSSLVYTGDTAFSNRLVKFSHGANLFISECSFPDSHPAEGHMTPSLVGVAASEAGVGGVLLVHLYPFFGGQDPVAVVEKNCHVPVTIAVDGMTIDVG